MKAKMNILIIFLFNLNYIISQKEVEKEAPKKGSDYPPIQCGKPHPNSSKDCTKYGTDSGMLCCWVSKDEKSKEGECVLIYHDIAEITFEIDGDAIFKYEKEEKNRYWNCGNKSIYLSINNIFIFISLLLFLIS